MLQYVQRGVTVLHTAQQHILLSPPRNKSSFIIGNSLICAFMCEDGFLVRPALMVRVVRKVSDG